MVSRTRSNPSVDYTTGRLPGSGDLSFRFDVKDNGKTTTVAGHTFDFTNNDLPDDVQRSSSLLRAFYLDTFGPVCRAEALKRASAGDTSYLGISRKENKTTTDVVVKNFKRISSQGGIINNPFNSRKVSFTMPPIQHGASPAVSDVTANAYNKYSFGDYYLSGYLVVTVSGLDSYCIVADDALVSKCIDGEIEHMSAQNAANTALGNISAGEIELLSAAAEAKDSIDLLVKTASRMHAIYKAIKKGNFKKLAPKTWRRAKNKKIQSTRLAEDAWLEARYAWRPLISDASTALKILNKGFQKRQTFRGSDSESDTFEVDFVHELSPGHSLHVVAQGTRERSVRAGVLTNISWSSSTGRSLGLHNWAGFVIDMIPFSFIVTWFVNLGGLIYKLNPNPGFQTLATWATKSTTINVIGSATYTAPDGTQKSTPIVYSVSEKDRQPDVVEPSYFSIDVDIGVSKLLDVLAIFTRR